MSFGGGGAPTTQPVQKFEEVVDDSPEAKAEDESRKRRLQGGTDTKVAGDLLGTQKKKENGGASATLGVR